MVGKELGSVVKEAGVKQCELSKRARMKASIVSEILSGKRIPTDEQLHKLIIGMEQICEILTIVNSIRFRVSVSPKD